MSVSKPRFERGVDMEAGIWSGLPYEILEQVLALVPVPDLCRYRTVCKAWKHLISDPTFAARHNAASTSCIVMSYCRRSRSHSYMFSESDKKNGAHLDQWCILDVRDRRWYMMGHDKHHRFKYNSNIMAMDGGLVCQFQEPKSSGLENAKSVIVHNPFANTARVLPLAPPHAWSMFYSELRLVVEPASTGFEIILINLGFNPYQNWVRVRPQHHWVCVYESATNEWRRMQNPPWITSRVGYICHSIMFEGWLCVLFWDERIYQLWRYDTRADVWEELGGPFSRSMYPKLLVVSDQRLFLASWYLHTYSSVDGSREERRFFYILYEVKVPGMVLREMVFKYSMAEMAALFEDDAEDCESCTPISTFGFGSCLLFMSNASGKTLMFDVVTRTWDRDWPRNPLMNNRREEHCSWVGEHMTLLLPSNVLVGATM